MNDLELNKTINLQRAASNPNNSVWVFASAGSGKTKILTDRVLRLLLEGVNPSKILCLTFTKVAAHEMQQRINEELSKWVLMNDAELKQKLHNLTGDQISSSQLKKAQTLLVKVLDSENAIKIQTIHSFCQNILKIFPFEANIKANFELLEGNQEKLLLQKAQFEVLQQAQKDPKIRQLAQNINAKLSEEDFAELLGEILQKKELFIEAINRFNGVENLKNAVFEIFSVNENENIEEMFLKFLRIFNNEENQFLADELIKSESDRNQEFGKKIRRFLANPSLNNFDLVHSAFFNDKNALRKVYGSVAKDQNFLDLLLSSSEIVKEFFDKKNAFNVTKNSSDLILFTSEILQKYQNLKNAGNFLDYNDLIIITNKLLSNPQYNSWIKMKLDGAFDHILVDESQDTNHKQWEIIKALSEDFFSGIGATNAKRSIFIVGDEKQSIYAFQGAEANISSEIYRYFNEKLGANLQKIELNNSFRSLPEILQVVDEVFLDPNLQKAITTESNFSGHKSIRSGNGVVEIWPQIFNPKTASDQTSSDDDSEEEATKSEEIEEKGGEILAKIISTKILSLVENKEANFADFMILLRNRTNGFSKQIIKEFQKNNISFSSVGSVKFSENLLVQDLMALANFALLPDDDLNLACLLKSPFFNFSEEDLLKLCLKRNQLNCTIFAVLEQNFSSKENAEENEFENRKILCFEHLQNIKTAAFELSAFEFFYKILKEQNLQKNFVINFGIQAIQIIDRFLSILQNFCQKSSQHLQKFVEFVDSLDPEISMESSEINSVKISTIHSAKGLQAKIVFLPDCCYNFKQSRTSKTKVSWLEFSDEKIFIPIWKSEKNSDISAIKEFSKNYLESAQNEYLRLLYVAMTRAENALYIAGFGNSKDPDCWYEIIKKQAKSEQLINLEELQEKYLNKSPKLDQTNENFSEQQIEESYAKADLASFNDFVFNNFTAAETQNRSPLSLWDTETRHESRPALRGSPSRTSMGHTGNRISNFSANRGKILHKIMEIFGKNYRENKSWLESISLKILEKDSDFTDQETLEIHNKIKQFLYSEQFHEIFSGEVFCEHEVIMPNQKLIGRIDLMVKQGHLIHIIDYKSGKRTEENLVQYQQQLQQYKGAVEKTYPNHKIRTSIFWLEDFIAEELAPEL